MGWTSTTLPYGKPIKEFFTQMFEWESDTHIYRILDSSLVHFSTWYAAMEITDKNTSEKEVIALVVLVHMQPKKYYNICYKEMTENEGPCERQCPKRILNLLTPTNEKYAIQWRKDCWERYNKKKNPSLKKGHYILFKEALHFNDGTEHRLLYISLARPIRLQSPVNGKFYRVSYPFLKTIEYKIIDLSSVPYEDLPLHIGDDPDVNKEVGRLLNRAA